MNVLCLCLFLVTTKLIGRPAEFNLGAAWLCAFAMDSLCLFCWSTNRRNAK